MAFNEPEVVRKQYSTEANLQARQALWVGAVGDDPKEVLWRTLSEWQPRRVLEVGGGQGELAERMKQELQADVTFVDISPRMVELARARRIEAQVGDVQELPFADGSFDTVVSAWMLYHVPDIDRGLAEMARVLVPGGALVAVTNSVDHISELRELMAYPPDAFEMSFNSENGEEMLRRHFAQVERVDTTTQATVTDREVLVAYQQSVSVPSQPVPEDVELPFVVHGRTTIFFATT